MAPHAQLIIIPFGFQLNWMHKLKLKWTHVHANIVSSHPIYYYSFFRPITTTTTMNWMQIVHSISFPSLSNSKFRRKSIWHSFIFSFKNGNIYFVCQMATNPRNVNCNSCHWIIQCRIPFPFIWQQFCMRVYLYTPLHKQSTPYIEAIPDPTRGWDLREHRALHKNIFSCNAECTFRVFGVRYACAVLCLPTSK